MTWWEAESGTLTPPLEIEHATPNVSGGAYVRVPDGPDTPPTSSGRLGLPGVATYVFNVPEDGIYRLALRISVPGQASSSSLWVRIPDMVTNTANHSSGWIDFDKIWQRAWQWLEVHSTTDGNQVVEFTLSAGTHTLEIAGKRAGTQFDAIALIR